MATIDKLLEKVFQEKAERVVLTSDTAIRLFVAGKEAMGPVLPSAQLRSLVHEVTPLELRPQLTYKSTFNFSYQSSHGVFVFHVVNEEGVLQVTITPHKAPPVAPIDFDNLAFSFDAPTPLVENTPSSTQLNPASQPLPIASTQPVRSFQMMPQLLNNFEKERCACCQQKVASVMWSADQLDYWHLCESCSVDAQIWDYVKQNAKLPSVAWLNQENGKPFLQVAGHPPQDSKSQNVCKIEGNWLKEVINVEGPVLVFFYDNRVRMPERIWQEVKPALDARNAKGDMHPPVKFVVCDVSEGKYENYLVQESRLEGVPTYALYYKLSQSNVRENYYPLKKWIHNRDFTTLESLFDLLKGTLDAVEQKRKSREQAILDIRNNYGKCCVCHKPLSGFDKFMDRRKHKNC